MPIRSGRAGIGRLRAGSKSPSAASFFFSLRGLVLEREVEMAARRESGSRNLAGDPDVREVVAQNDTHPFGELAYRIDLRLQAPIECDLFHGCTAILLTWRWQEALRCGGQR
jgi:hypothetical protein